MKSVLITGGSGFFGGILKRSLLAAGTRVVNIDLQPDEDRHEALSAIQGDIRDKDLVAGVFRNNKFDATYHCAAILAHTASDRRALWTSNVDGTRIVAEGARRTGVSHLVFTSSNCLWGRGFEQPVTEAEPPAPVETYGRSKWEGEKILREFSADMNTIVLRCPTIVDSGRLGLLTILFEFVDEGRRVWTVGDGSNRYQFIHAADLVDACVRSASHGESGVFHVGSDDVKPMAAVYQYLIDRADTGARLARLPKGAALFAMQVAHRLNVSPLGPYQYKMIAESFVFDTTKIKSELHWQPTLGNGEMLYLAYRYWRTHRQEIERRTQVSAHRQAAKMGVIRLLKWLS